MTNFTTTLTPAAPTARGWRAKLTRNLTAVIKRLWLYRQVQRERTQLLALTDRELHDIGITRYDALREAARPFWHV